MFTLYTKKRRADDGAYRIGMLIFASASGFCISFTLFLVLILRIPTFGHLLLDIPKQEASQTAELTAQQTLNMAEATGALGSFWWWAGVFLLAFLIAYQFLRNVRGMD